MDDDWRLWLTAAGLPTDLSKQPGVSFDIVYMTLQAAIDGLGVAMGRTSYVQDDIAKGRLVMPFEIQLPVDAGFYLVSPDTKADSPKLSAFRKWVMDVVKAKPEPLAEATLPMALLILRETSAMGPLLALHLGVVFALFLTLPYGKFVHGIYRFVALVRYAQERRAVAHGMPEEE